LRREFEVLAIGESESVNEYFARTLAIANHMTAHGERVEQVMVVEKIKSSTMWFVRLKNQMTM
jgi:hypothetical protein